MEEIIYSIDGENSLLRGSYHATGFDLQCSEDFEILPGKHKLVKTGLRFHSVPENVDIQVRSRSGLALKNGVFVLNGVGTIDSDYNGEVCVILANFGDEKFSATKGSRIAQIVFSKFFVPKLVSTNGETLSSDKKNYEKNGRGQNGFGSTGI